MFLYLFPQEEGSPVVYCLLNVLARTLLVCYIEYRGKRPERGSGKGSTQPREYN
jgi:hypothetical protein